MDYPAWGEEEVEETLPPLPSSKLTKFTINTSTLNVTSSSDNWDDDDGGGGWGNTTNTFDNYSTRFNDVEVTTEELEDEEVLEQNETNKEFNNNQQDDMKAVDWNHSKSPIVSAYIDSIIPTSSSSFEAPLPSTSTPLPSELSSTTFDSPSQEEPEPESDNWGNYGNSPTLAPIISKNEESIPIRDLDWSHSTETELDLPTAMPSFGDSFTSSRKSPVMLEVEKGEAGEGGEGWGGGEMEWKPSKVIEEENDYTNRESQSVESQASGDGAWSTESSQGFANGKIISAAFVDGIKDKSRTFAKSNWDVSSDSWSPPGFQEQANLNPILSTLSQPPELPSSSNTTSITTNTPLSSLFKLTPTLYPAFKTGLDKTALRSAETLKGTSSAAYRNARFGKGNLVRNVGGVGRGAGGSELTGESLWDSNSSLSIPVLPSDRGMAGDEFDLDGPGNQSTTTINSRKSSWWGASGGQNVLTTTNMPKSLLSKKEEEEVTTVGIIDTTTRTITPNPSDPPPGAIGRFFGRFGKNSTSSEQSSTSSPSTTSNGEISGWTGDLGFLDTSGPVLKPIPRSNEMPVKVVFDDLEDEEKDHQDPLGSFFSDKTAPPREIEGSVEFGGLLGSFGTIAPIRSNNSIFHQQQQKKNKSTGSSSLDPFDPFGDDDQLSLAGPPTLTTSSFPASSLKMNSQLTMSPPLLPTSRSNSPGMLAPQARGMSVLPTFDAFGSYSAGPSPVSSPALVSSPSISTTSSFSIDTLQPTIVPRPFISPPISLSPVQYTSNKLASLSIPSSSKPLSSFISSPPSATSPIVLSNQSYKGFGGLTPPPSILSSASIPRNNLNPPIPNTVKVLSASKYIPPPSNSTSGPLGLDDLSFFES